MSNQGIATISRESDILVDEFHGMGFGWVEKYMVDRMIREGDVIGNREWNVWVESASRAPSELQDHPHVVFCVESNELGSAVNRTYKPVS